MISADTARHALLGLLDIIKGSNNDPLVGKLVEISDWHHLMPKKRFLGQLIVYHSIQR